MRPTSDKVRAAVFSSLGDTVEGARFLDLFAGTGAVGIEAYSRGAAHITFVEKHAETLRRNVELMPKAAYTLVRSELFRSGLTGAYDIIYIDPPYGCYNPAEVLNWIDKHGLLAANGVIVYEESVRTRAEWEQMPFGLIKKRKYGDTLIFYYEGVV